MNKEVIETNATNPAKAENSASGNNLDVKPAYMDITGVSVKELLARPEVQAALQKLVFLPEVVVVKKVRKPFEDKETKTTSQKIEVISGTTLEDFLSFELTLLNAELKEEAINKKFRIVDFTFALSANMKDGKFSGYAARGLRVMATKLEEVRGN
ncbi:MAG: hypothetical protein NC321_14240 [Clostridium sp.]|nr:hypothetical protein [Clostridium sp.]